MKSAPRALLLSTAVAALLLLLSFSEVEGIHGATIRVPSDQPTIQDGINLAIDGDVVVVAPGTYYENIDFLGKRITVISEGCFPAGGDRCRAGAEATIIDGNRAGSVVTFERGEGRGSNIRGFTLQNGSASQGGGIFVFGAAPTIWDNVITNNQACSGAGIAARFASPYITLNVISGNFQGGCSGGIGGGGISIAGSKRASEPPFGSARIIGNVISDNVLTSANGAGISLTFAGTPIIRDNIISGNAATGVFPCNEGGGISIVNASDALIVQNVITGNSAGCGGGIYFGVPQGRRGPFLVNNTIVDNEAATGAGVYADGYDSQTLLVNNIIVETDADTAVYCSELRDPRHPIFRFNNVRSNGTAYGGVCADQTGVDGNISADPLLVDPSDGDYHLGPGSPLIDAGDNTAPGLHFVDFEGWDLRIVDGNGDREAVIDMGADELPVLCPTGNNSGLLGPKAQIADTGGDGDGFEVKPFSAFSNDFGISRNIDGAGDRHRYYNYGVVANCDINAIQGIRVRIDWGLDSTAGRNSMSVELSWDGGASWTAPKTDTTETASAGDEGGIHAATLGGANDTWGRAWTVSELRDTNFMVRVTANCSKGPCKDRDYFLDWVAVKVNYGPQ